MAALIAIMIACVSSWPVWMAGASGSEVGASEWPLGLGDTPMITPRFGGAFFIGHGVGEGEGSALG